MNYNCSNFLDLRNLQEQVKKAFCYQKLFWTFAVWINCSSDLKFFVNSRPSALNFTSFSRTLERFFLWVGQNNFDNKIPNLTFLVRRNSRAVLQLLRKWGRFSIRPRSPCSLHPDKTSNKVRRTTPLLRSSISSFIFRAGSLCKKRRKNQVQVQF